MVMGPGYTLFYYKEFNMMDKDISKFTCLWENDFRELAIDFSPQSSSIEIEVQIEELICL